MPWEEQLPVKTQAKKLLNTSAFSISVVTISCLIYGGGRGGGVNNFFCLPFLTKVPVEALTILHIPCQIQLQLCLSFPDSTPTLPAVPLYSSQDMCPCFHCLCISLMFQLDHDILSHAGLLPSLPDFLHRGMESSSALRKMSLNRCQLSSAPLPLKAVPQGVPATSSLNKRKFALLRFTVFIILFTWSIYLEIMNSTSE